MRQFSTLLGHHIVIGVAAVAIDDPPPLARVLDGLDAGNVDAVHAQHALQCLHQQRLRFAAGKFLIDVELGRTTQGAGLGHVLLAGAVVELPCSVWMVTA